MKAFVLIFALCFATASVAEKDRGRDLMAEALRLFMQGFMAEMEPAFTELERFVQDLNGYHPPEVLPNGDIIIRRKKADEDVTENGDIEL